MVRILGFHSCGLGSIPGRGTEILHAVWCGQGEKTKQKQNKKQINEYHLNRENERLKIREKKENKLMPKGQ